MRVRTMCSSPPPPLPPLRGAARSAAWQGRRGGAGWKQGKDWWPGRGAASPEQGACRGKKGTAGLQWLPHSATCHRRPGRLAPKARHPYSSCTSAAPHLVLLLLLLKLQLIYVGHILLLLACPRQAANANAATRSLAHSLGRRAAAAAAAGFLDRWHLLKAVVVGGGDAGFIGGAWPRRAVSGDPALPPVACLHLVFRLLAVIFNRRCAPQAGHCTGRGREGCELAMAPGPLPQAVGLPAAQNGQHVGESRGRGGILLLHTLYKACANRYNMLKGECWRWAIPVTCRWAGRGKGVAAAGAHRSG